MSPFTSKIDTVKEAFKRRFEEAPEQIVIAGVTILAMVAKASNDLAGVSSKRAYSRMHGKKK